jgi:hypothetical protein
VLETDGRRYGVGAPAHGEDGRWIGLERRSSWHCDGWAGQAQVAGGLVVRTEGEWFGEGWSLRAHPCTRSALRSWDWSGGPSYHGTRLVVHHRRPVPDAHAWLARRAPLPYTRRGPDRFEEADRPERAAFIELSANRVVFCRGLHVGEAVSAVTAGLLDDLIGGVLGPLAWDVVDDDWGVCRASGPDAGSLAAFLDPRADLG